MTRPLPLQWPYAILYWGVFIWTMLPESGLLNRARRQQTTTDAKSLQIVMLGQGLGSLLAFVLAAFPVWRIAPGNEPAVFFVGVALLIAGSLLRRHCFRMLGASFTGDVRATPDQRIVDRGAYRFLRHPSYTAGVLMTLGTAVALGSWLSVIVLVGLTWAAYVYRIAVEERTLLAVIGEPYRQFIATRKRLIPFIY